MVTKMFPMHAVLTIRTAILMGPFGEAHELMEWILGIPIWTHEMRYYMKFAEERLQELYPHLPTEATKDTWQKVLSDAIVQFGAKLPFKKGSMERKYDPIETAMNMFGKDKVIPVVVGE